MRAARALLFATITAVASIVAVQASAQTIPVPTTFYTVPTTFYIRGDLGWSGSTGADIHDATVSGPMVNPLIVTHAIAGANGSRGELNNIGDALFIGTGVGMQFAPFFRGDIVYTYRGDYRLDDVDFAGTRFKSNIFSNSVMVNGYFDYPYSGFIPYLGFGIGWAETQMSSLSATTTSSVGVNPLIVNPPATGTNITAVAPGGSSDNFAWQIMVGAGIPLSDGVMFDMFYRYFDGGRLRTDSGTVLVGTTAVGTYAGVQGALHANELGVGVRFAL